MNMNPSSHHSESIGARPSGFSTVRTRRLRHHPLIRSLVYPDPAHAEAVSDRLARDDLFQHELHLKPRAPAR